MRILILAVALIFAFSTTARADELSDLKEQLDAAMKQIQSLQKRVETLEAEKTKAEAAAPAAAAPAAAGAAAQAAPKAVAPEVAAAGPVVAPNTKPVEGAPDADKARVELYGFVQADFIQGFKLMNPDWYSSFRPSQIPVVCPGPPPGNPGCGADGYTNFSVKQTRLGVNAFLPTSEGEVRGQFEFDLYGVGADAGQTTIRVRQAWASLGQFLVGQTNSLFMDGDVFPNIIDYWGPSGMVFFRNIQARWTPIDKEGNRFAIALENPGTVVDNTSAGMANVSAHNTLPDFTAQYRMDRNWGHLQLSGILRSLGYDTPSAPGGTPSGSKTGYGLNVAGSYNTFGKDKVNAQIAYGKGIANYSNDCCVDLASNAAGSPEAVPLLEWLLYYDHWWADAWSTSIGYSRNFQNNTSGQATTAQRIGDYASVNLLWYPVRNVMAGVELMWGERGNFDGSSANDTRIQFSAQYKF
ncbi:MAG TPA: DcaP family trimeric outer membrane transporter [Burkholderiales bacterium]|nr:DcaP family trimeric outer membrane transporter [Burkholderiales bacterium]